MEITLNGDCQDIAEGTTVAQLLVQRDLADKPCAVEVNRVLVPRAEHATHELATADEIEIVTLVGGG